MRHLLSRKVQQAPGTNQEEEEVVEATEDEVVQEEVVVVVAVVTAISIRAGGVVEIVEALALDHRVFHPLAMIRTTELRNQGQHAIGVRKRGTGSKIAIDISQRKRRTRKARMDKRKNKLAM
jgi:hypothetical protein